MPSHLRATTRDELATRPSYRPELQGLRAVAILMVVCYHIWFGRVSGGVDIFLLISSFLLTGSFARKLERDRPLKVPRYWLHAFKRLVPPAAVTILLTVGAALLFLPASRWREILTQAVASLGYYENIYLAENSVDYYAQDHSAASPLQHFWSLSIQGQVFFLWPLLFALGALLVRRFHLPVRATLLSIFGAVFAGSLAWSISFTASDQTYAYFDTRTRLWEFALGSLLALVLPAIEQRLRYRVPGDPSVNGAKTLRIVLGWLGLALILSAGFLLDVQGSFPGWIALWPTLAASIVIAAGPTRSHIGADRLLSTRPLLWLGDISYALYLVHWPLLVIVLATTGATHAGFWVGALLVASSIVLAWLLTKLVDAPIRYSAWLDARLWRSGVAIAASAALVVAGVGTTTGVLDRQAAAAEARAALDNPGARSLQPGFVFQGNPNAAALPLEADLGDDWYAIPDRCHGRIAPPADIDSFCSTSGVPRASKTLVLIGNSRLQQYSASLVPAAEAAGWSVVSVLHGGCLFGGEGMWKECDAKNLETLHYLQELRPSVVAIESSFVPEEGQEQAVLGLSDIVTTLTAQGTDVIAFRDMPRVTFDPASCLETGADCSTDVTATYPAEIADGGLAPASGDGSGRLLRVDLTDQICPGRICVPRIGNTNVWMDRDHISATYSASMREDVEQQLSSQGWDW